MKITKFIFVQLTIIITYSWLNLALADNIVLFTAYKDYGHSFPFDEAIYSIYKSGKHAKTDWTNKKGQVILEWNEGEIIKDGYFRLDKIGSYGFTVEANGLVHRFKIGDFGFDYEDVVSPCSDKEKSCTGKGFYWIRLYGFSTFFKGEPYELEMNNVKRNGHVGKDGFILIPSDNPDTTAEVIVNFCFDKSLKMSLGHHKYRSTAKWFTANRAGSNLDCQTSQMKSQAEKQKYFNDGAPLAFGGWSLGKTPEEKLTEKNNQQMEEDSRYAEMAKNNNDELSWLGPLPIPWSDEEASKRADDFVNKIYADVHSLAETRIPWKDFMCKTPEQVGNIPNMNDVNSYMEIISLRNYDKLVMAENKLKAAAKLGNWLAISQLYASYRSISWTKDSRVNEYRQLQLGEWLLNHKIGGIYRETGFELGATGFFSDVSGQKISPFDIYAALNNSYPAQYDVGVYLLESDNEDAKKIGERMINCALSALPAYKKILPKLKEAR